MRRRPQAQLHICDDQQRAFGISNNSYSSGAPSEVGFVSPVLAEKTHIGIAFSLLFVVLPKRVNI